MALEAGSVATFRVQRVPVLPQNIRDFSGEARARPSSSRRDRGSRGSSVPTLAVPCPRFSTRARAVHSPGAARPRSAAWGRRHPGAGSKKNSGSGFAACCVASADVRRVAPGHVEASGRHRRRVHGGDFRGARDRVNQRATRSIVRVAGQRAPRLLVVRGGRAAGVRTTRVSPRVRTSSVALTTDGDPIAHVHVRRRT